MKSFGLSRYAISTSAAAALLAGCGGSQLPVAARGGLSQASTVATHAERGGSWVLPEAKSENLLYISDATGDAVYVFSYPAGRLVGKLTGFIGVPYGLCVDKTGDVFVVDSGGMIDVYAHGGASPIRKLKTDGSPYGCAIDPTTGNLAVTNLFPPINGNVEIYIDAKGKPREYGPSNNNAAFFCSYDSKGNLFFDGFHSASSFIFQELPKGSNRYKTIRLNRTIQSPGGVQWDGKYVAVGDQAVGIVYRTNGAGGKVEDSVTLDSGVRVAQFWIQGSAIVGASRNGRSRVVRFWKYPVGGFPTREFAARFKNPIGATVSLAR